MSVVERCNEVLGLWFGFRGIYVVRDTEGTQMAAANGLTPRRVLSKTPWCRKRKRSPENEDSVIEAAK